MPITSISLRKGKTAEYRRAVADSVHAALVETIGIPADDRFQLIDQFDEDSFIYDRTFLGMERTDDLIIVRITLVSGRPRELRSALHRSIAEKLSYSPGVRPDDVFISLVENDRADWSVGRGETPLLKPAEAS